MTFLTILLIFFSATISNAASITLSWSYPTQLTGIAGYRVYQSAKSGVYNKATDKKCDVSPAVTECTINNIPDGMWHWVATFYDSSGNEADYSNEVSHYIGTMPSPMINLRVK